MNDNVKYIIEMLKKNKEYQATVFEQGFLLTNKCINLTNEYPFYGNWNEVELCEKFYLYVHCDQKSYIYKKNGKVFFLIGHAYDPFSYMADENIILEKFSDMSNGDFLKGLKVLDDLTGLFLLGIIDEEGDITFCGDFESMRTTYYGKVNDTVYVSSHEEIIAFYEELHFDAYVRKLEKYKWYRLYGEGLPGDISHYVELKKLICNTYITYSNGEFLVHRMWPRNPIDMCDNNDEYESVVKQIAQVMSNSMDLIAEKWENPAVSVTGGRDSKGSLAAAVHIKEKYQFYSYNSQYAERVDCEAANLICTSIGVKHTTYTIPLEKELYPEYDLVKAILTINSNRCYFNHNDIMKRIYFRKKKPFDVEVKSWTSEIGRAFYYKRYGVRKMQKKCTARRVNAMNNIFLFNPLLMYQTDKRYADYLKKTHYNEHMYNYDWSDIIDLEMRDSRWGADVISCEHMFSHDVTIPYNNRHLGELFLSVPFENRLKDKTHIDFTNELCPEIEKTNINVKDFAHNNKRMWMDKIYYFVTSIRPF